MFILRLIFIFFVFGGFAAFLGFSVGPIYFWLNNGYWNLADPPKLIILVTCFLAFHTAIGILGILYFHLNKSEENTEALNSHADKPWKTKTYWQENKIKSHPLMQLAFAKLASKYYTVISLIPTFAIYESIKLLDYTALIGLIFPAFALFIFLRYQTMLEHSYRYEQLCLKLDPYPARIGGLCAGRIFLEERSLDIQYVRVDLHCVKRDQKYGNIEQTILWNRSIQGDVSDQRHGQNIEFSLDLTHNLKQSQADDGFPFISWEINVDIKLKDGTGLKRIFRNIPVFKVE